MFVISIDTDWAPDFILEHVSNILTKRQVKATWFVTNNSPFLNILKKNPLFEIGIHPNFDLHSTHGNDPDSVLNHLKQIVPYAKSVRTHALLQSTRILLKFNNYGIENDVSLFLPRTPNLLPHHSEYFKLYRYPYFWEDDFYMANRKKWSIKDSFFQMSGMKILDFHPIHIYLNSKNMTNYDSIKNDIGLSNITKKNTEQYINTEESGTNSMFNELTLSLENQETYTIQDLRKIFEPNIQKNA